MNNVKLIAMHFTMAVALVFFVGCGNKDKEARAQAQLAQQQYAQLAAQNAQMKTDYDRITGCLRDAKTDSERALCH